MSVNRPLYAFLGMDSAPCWLNFLLSIADACHLRHAVLYCKKSTIVKALLLLPIWLLLF